MAFVQSPCSCNGQVGLTHFFKDQTICLHCPLQQAGVGGGKMKPFRAQQHPGGFGLGNSLAGERHVVPTREQVQFIPGALAVSKKNQGSGHS